MQKKRLEIKHYRDKELARFSPGLFPLKKTANIVDGRIMLRRNFVRDNVNGNMLRERTGQIYTEMIPFDFSLLEKNKSYRFFS